MSKPVIDLLESERFNEIGHRTQRRTTWELWERIKIRMSIRAADQVWCVADILEGVRPVR